MIVYHVSITAADDYLTRREGHRAAHLERIAALRAGGLCVGGGPAPDGRTADIFYRVQQPGDAVKLIEEDPYFTGGVWSSYRTRSFSQFLDPWELPPVVVDGSRRVTIVEGQTDDIEMASFALIEARGAGRMSFGGFFPDGQTLALFRAADPAEAVASLEVTGLWKPGTLRGRPFLHVL
ncbi:MAG TPA: hypothetical protein VEL75_23730 [Candidatus Methylomirabilis sp.]|nr:hypothetical protein [Candidatus Methylomirabilis sp.]